MDLVNCRVKTKGLITDMPPRHGKSWFYGLYLPVWFAGTYPEKRIGYISYSDRQARKFGRRSRNVFKEVAPILWDLKVSDHSSAANEWNIQGYEGGMESAGVGGALTGNGFHLLILDDVIKNDEEAVSEVYREKVWEFFHSTAMTRLEPGGFVIINGTRWHEDDLQGRLQQTEDYESRWTTIHFPAIAEEDDALGRQPGEALWPMRYPLQTTVNNDGVKLQGLEDIKKDMPAYWWNALYQGRPTKHGSVEWPQEYFKGDDLWFDEWPDNLCLRCMSLDPSKGRTRYSDYSAFILLGQTPDGTIWVEADLERRPAGQIVEDGVKLIKSFKPEAFGLEGNAWQDLLQPLFTPALQDELRNKTLEILSINNMVAKEIRIRRLDPFLRGRRCKFRNNRGTRLLVNQLREFPMAIHDDGPDAFEMATRVGHYLLTAELGSGMSLGLT